MTNSARVSSGTLTRLANGSSWEGHRQIFGIAHFALIACISIIAFERGSMNSLAELNPAAREAELARVALVQIRAAQEVLALGESDSVTITVHGAEQKIEVPSSVFNLIGAVLGKVSAGEGVTLIPSNAELTTQQAADMLNVSRPFLIGLLESNEIEYRKVGSHRRVLAVSLMSYLKIDNESRRQVVDELIALDQETGSL